MAKNIVVCCDGTGNEVGREEVGPTKRMLARLGIRKSDEEPSFVNKTSNVLKLYRCLKNDKTQTAIYDPGVGTLGGEDWWRPAAEGIQKFRGLALGWGLDANVMETYRAIVEAYQKGDRIYLFGFSRGAFTVRVVAGMIHLVGLLKPEQSNLIPYALRAYKESKVEVTVDEDAVAEEMKKHGIDSDFRPHATQRESYGRYFGRIIDARRVPIRFVGVWDTVGSVLAPNRFGIPRKLSLPHVWNNPSVEDFRQACSVDEKRRFFRLDGWNTTPFINPVTGKEGKQGVKQVWFAGYHSDVGGGLPEEENNISVFALRWMIGEALDCKLVLDMEMVRHLTEGNLLTDQAARFSPYRKPQEDKAKVHNSMGGAWPFLEIFPKWTRRAVWPGRPRWLPWRGYFPLGEPRIVPDNAAMHWSADYRWKHKVHGYAPKNWPKNWPAEGTVVDDLPLPETDTAA